MKKICFFLLAICLIGIACEKKESMEEDDYPIEIPFTEYSLAGTSCQWKPLSYPYPYRDTVIIINSKEDLEKYIECIGESDYPVIDFSTHTLLFAHGIASSGSVKINSTVLQQLSEQNYRMKIEISIGFLTVMTDWQVPIIINKLSDGCIIESIVAIKQDKL